MDGQSWCLENIDVFDYLPESAQSFATRKDMEPSCHLYPEKFATYGRESSVPDSECGRISPIFSQFHSKWGSYILRSKTVLQPIIAELPKYNSYSLYCAATWALRCLLCIVFT
ncbi:hypothetical protein BDW59DRAFT_94050 [Aspergillus cavernicola]|uniref:Uncharacterized protein n=1 Tax=Aspergillus cavernicola TaxID=176166 RepID=A0ABR4IYW4_9EURO